MEKRKLTSTVYLYDGLEELPAEIQSLMKTSWEIRDKAYAPYSGFLVGAALQLENGKIVTGSNQENAAYPSGLCAERTAIFYAGANYPEQKITAMAISVKSNHKKVEKPTPPCGACRQAIAEYERKQDQPIAIYFMGEAGKIAKVNSLSALLPLAFDRSFL